MKVYQNQQGRIVRRGQRTQGADGSQRIIAAGLLRLAVGGSGDLQSPLHIPQGQPPILAPAHAGDLGQGVVMLMADDPQARKAGRDQFGQALCK